MINQQLKHHHHRIADANGAATSEKRMQYSENDIKVSHARYADEQ